MSPLPGHTILNRRFSEHHRAAVAGAHTATIRIDRVDDDPDNDTDGWSPGTGAAEAAPDVVVWTGQARVQAQASGALVPETAGQDVPVRSYTVFVGVDCPPLRAGSKADQGDAIVVLTCPDDPQLVGRTLRIVDITFGTLLWERALVATDNLPANGPPPGDPAAQPDGGP